MLPDGARKDLLLINDWELDFSDDELVDLVFAVASSNMSKSALTESWCSQN